MRGHKMKNTWTTKEGKVIPISELTDEHLTNIIKHIRRKVNIAIKDYDVEPADIGLDSFGDEDVFSNPNYIQPTLENFLPKGYYDLVEESRKRNLKVQLETFCYKCKEPMTNLDIDNYTCNKCIDITFKQVVSKRCKSLNRIREGLSNG
jgi:hypothetical protein